jgi:hypothetical protein
MLAQSLGHGVRGGMERETGGRCGNVASWDKPIPAAIVVRSLGANVPVTEPDFGCGDGMFGGGLA